MFGNATYRYNCPRCDWHAGAIDEGERWFRQAVAEHERAHEHEGEPQCRCPDGDHSNHGTAID